MGLLSAIVASASAYGAAPHARAMAAAIVALAVVADGAVAAPTSAAGASSEASQAGSRRGAPDTAKPDTAKPDAAKPDAAKPDATKPDAAKTDSTKPDPAKPETKKPEQVRFDIGEYRVEGADALAQIDVEAAVYPFLGPDKTAEDVEKARAALEKAYHDRGLQTVGVSVPQQNALRGFVVLKVTENKVGRLRVKGSRYFDLEVVKEKAPSLREGKLPNLKNVTKDIVALNQWPDRRVTPSLRPGVAPGTVDVDLNVEDKLPLHGSVEINNRQSPSTTPLRFIATLRYDNLWQRGDSITVSYQNAPLNIEEVEVFSGSYLARTPQDWLNILVYGLKSKSSVATVGGATVVGPGQVIGTRAVITLPARGELFHTLSLGFDYKRFEQSLFLGPSGFSSPIAYAPIVGTYVLSLQGEGRLTQYSATVTGGTRGLGSDTYQFDTRRFGATGSFLTVRSDLSHTQDFWGGAQFYVRALAQLADQPLVSSEQIASGGLDTVRGYLEVQTLGDFGGIGTAELRTPNIGPLFDHKYENAAGETQTLRIFDEWRFFAFTDASRVRIKQPLPEQQQQFDLASWGLGTRFRAFNYLNGLIVFGVPLIPQQQTRAHDPRINFRFWGEF